MSGKRPPRHQHALIGDENVEAALVEEWCEGDRDEDYAQRIIQAGKDGRLIGQQCGNRLFCRFGKTNAWHFAIYSGQPDCDHPDEPRRPRGAHTEAVRALADALREANPSWSVRSPYWMKQASRRADVLATPPDRSVGFALEVIAGSVPWREFEQRSRELAQDAGVNDQWLWCDRNPYTDRNAISDFLDKDPRRRLIYIGRFERDHLHAYETFYSYKLPHEDPEISRLRLYCRSRSEIPSHATDHSKRHRTYDLSMILLHYDGTLRTDLDGYLDRKAREYVASVRAIEQKRAQERTAAEMREKAVQAERSAAKVAANDASATDTISAASPEENRRRQERARSTSPPNRRGPIERLRAWLRRFSGS